MLLCRFEDSRGQVGCGRLLDGGLVQPLRGDLFAPPHPTGEPLRPRRLLAPVDPPNILAIGLNYKGHAAEQNLTRLPEEPLIFIKATTSLAHPGDPIVLPAPAPDEVDFEGELAVIIARRCKDVSEAKALNCVLGFTCANDVSARDCQKRRDKQWARGKSFDTFCPLGPAVATPDAFDCFNARLRTTVSGERMQDASTADLIFPVPVLVSYLSRQFTLLPGTVILTGTPAGVGFTRNPPRFLRRGDEVTVEIDGIGRLTNPVA